MDKTFLIRHSRFGVLLLLAAGVVGAAVYFHSVLLPFVLAIFLAYLIAPIIRALTSLEVRGRRMWRGAAILLTYAVFALALFFTGRFVVPHLVGEFNRIVRELPSILVEIEGQWIAPAERRLNVWMAEFFPTPGEQGPVTDPTFGAHEPDGSEPGAPAEGNGSRPPWQVLVEDYTFVVHDVGDDRYEVVPQRRSEQPAENGEHTVTGRPITAAFGQLRAMFEENFFELIQIGRRHLTAVVSSFFTTFLVFMISAFILVDPQRILGFLRSLVPAAHQQRFDELVHRLDHGLSGVVRGQLLICLINGTLTGVGLVALGVPFTFTLTFIATVFSLIPIFGVLISSVPIVLMALSVSVTTALLIVAWILVIHFIEGNFLNPKILGDAARIHPALVVFALMVGQYTAGVLGALVAVPVFSLVQSSFLYVKHLAENLETAR